MRPRSWSKSRVARLSVAVRSIIGLAGGAGGDWGGSAGADKARGTRLAGLIESDCGALWIENERSGAMSPASRSKTGAGGLAILNETDEARRGEGNQVVSQLKQLKE